MAQKGQLNFVFADGNLSADGYETLTVTNLCETVANLTFDIYFCDRAPVKGLTCTVEAERVNCFRLDEPFSDQKYKIPYGRYSLVLHSDIPVVAVMSRREAGGYSVQGYTY